MKECAYKKCGVTFLPRTHNQRFHSSECLRQATNSRIMEDYYAKKDRRKGGVRTCESAGCSTVLSRYNDDKICSKCSSERQSTQRQGLLRMLSVAGRS